MVLLNFAYGSNMLSARLRQRVPGAQLIGTATLRGHALRWHKVAKDGSGKCDIVLAEPGSAVHGVLYEIPAHEKQHLDRAEGLGIGYAEKEILVECRTAIIMATAYVATKVDERISPFTWYRALVVAGAVEHGLPIAYVDGLRAIDAKLDVDAQRHAQHMALAAHR
ncbi:gamma-glutamylcyclotransferase family protein [Cyanobium gracile]|uniref:Gamma-glutamylcyclotransferase family protein n=1 Tax=Cyanobium gracile UHCC 0281 TaxID=3110309 RepID=A0ABU5SZI5_9CYAN|nr:gamma-glutamylcyclotransferase family protein [Cyanobium gracile]MEA5443932.1 gamma-glutamylcyclotransferase family protein [Cyanobium gracile UHCC 0281]